MNVQPPLKVRVKIPYETTADPENSNHSGYDAGDVIWEYKWHDGYLIHVFVETNDLKVPYFNGLKTGDYKEGSALVSEIKFLIYLKGTHTVDVFLREQFEIDENYFERYLKHTWQNK